MIVEKEITVFWKNCDWFCIEGTLLELSVKYVVDSFGINFISKKAKIWGTIS